MWVAELKLWHEGSEILEITKKYDVTAYSVYLNVFTRKGHSHISKVMAIHGKDAKNAITELVRVMKRYRIVRVQGNYIFFTIPIGTLSYHTSFLDENVFFVKPFRIEGGYEYWTVASWDKNNIHRLLRNIQRDDPHSKVDLLKLKQEPPESFVPDAMARLGTVQSRVLQDAIASEYYGYPRKVSLKELAKRLHLAPATVREHLRKAEAKVLPAATEQMVRE
ncbi:helix-turn-helix domain-containing protein [Candidatus Micrarchaeota archaeon]|nr:helix-turn-helix domain-containing protein [Candidatus Micrarchaeota archaeon]